VLAWFCPATHGTKGETILIFASVFISGHLNTLIDQTGVVARSVLGILLFLSLVSWTIIFQKSGSFGRTESQTKRLLEVFRSSRSLPDPQTLRLAAGSSPLVRVYEAGYREFNAQLQQAQTLGATSPGGTHKLKNPQAIFVTMRVASSDEIRRLERYMSWLATTGSVSPFIGLFGTVWGVMDSFAGLGDAGAASLRAVAPGIAEALITTAAGLAAAIPAVVAYNHYLTKIRGMSTRLDNFAMEFVSKVETFYN